MPIFVKTIKQQGCFFKVVVAMNNKSSLLLKVISNTLGKARILTDEEILSFGKTRN